MLLQQFVKAFSKLLTISDFINTHAVWLSINQNWNIVPNLHEYNFPSNFLLFLTCFMFFLQTKLFHVQWNICVSLFLFLTPSFLIFIPNL